MRQRNVNADIADLPGVRVNNYQRFLASCRDKLINARLFGENIQWIPLGERSAIQYLSDGRGVQGGGRNGPYPVVPLFDAAEPHWVGIGFGAALRTVVGDLVTNATLRIYRGNATDLEKRLLFRAQWKTEQDSALAHAQPHWHIHEPGHDRAPESHDIITIEDEEELGRPREWEGVRIHLPMAARFHECVQSCVIGATADGLKDWIIWTISYLRQELFPR
jgi:hypothetical protein